MYLVKTPQFIQNLFPNFTWRIPTVEKVLYLTFDDGPIPEVTPWVLQQLEAFNAKATFQSLIASYLVITNPSTFVRTSGVTGNGWVLLAFYLASILATFMRGS